MGMTRREMVPGRKCYIQTHKIPGDSKSPIIESKAIILAPPILSTVLVELDGVMHQRMDVPINCVYWTRQD